MKKPHFFSVMILLLLNGCGGGDLTDIAEGGIGGTGITNGSISAFGSVYVNGRRYTTEDVSVFMNGKEVSLEQLRLGMMISLTHPINSDHAQRIEFTESVSGSITHIDLEQQHLTVALQQVNIDERTVFYPVEGLAGMAVGDVIRVSGLPIEDGIWLATRIDNSSDQDLVSIQGRVQHLNTETFEFHCGGLTVDYHLLNDLMPLKGQRLYLSGHLEKDRLIASQWQFIEPMNASLKNLRGHITRFVSPYDFDIAFQAASITSNTSFELGMSDDLYKGAEVISRGQMDNAGVFQISDLTFMGQSSQRTASGQTRLNVTLDAIDIEQRQLWSAGQLIQVPTTALFVDPHNPDAPFSFAQLRIGESLKIYGFIDLQMDMWIAERLQRTNGLGKITSQYSGSD